jgi:hypothetical protein
MTQEIRASSLFKHDLIEVAPKPVFTRLDGFHNRVLRGAKMLGGVLVLRGVAAAYMAASLAKPQVHPGVAHFDALLAGVNLGFEVANLVGVRASVGHGFPSSSYPET